MNWKLKIPYSNHIIVCGKADTETFITISQVLENNEKEKIVFVWNTNKIPNEIKKMINDWYNISFVSWLIMEKSIQDLSNIQKAKTILLLKQNNEIDASIIATIISIRINNKLLEVIAEVDDKIYIDVAKSAGATKVVYKKSEIKKLIWLDIYCCWDYEYNKDCDVWYSKTFYEWFTTFNKKDWTEWWLDTKLKKLKIIDIDWKKDITDNIEVAYNFDKWLADFKLKSWKNWKIDKSWKVIEYYSHEYYFSYIKDLIKFKWISDCTESRIIVKLENKKYGYLIWLDKWNIILPLNNSYECYIRTREYIVTNPNYVHWWKLWELIEDNVKEVISFLEKTFKNKKIQEAIFIEWYLESNKFYHFSKEKDNLNNVSLEKVSLKYLH